MNTDILNLLTALALGALSADVYLQIQRVIKVRSSEDVSIIGVLIRFAAALIMLIKFAWLQDNVLIWGQVVIVALITYYLILLARLRPKPKKNKRR